MKIAFIGQKGIPAVSGGVEKHVENVAVRLAERGHEVFVYVRRSYVPESVGREYRGVKLITLPAIRTKHLEAISHSFLATLHAIFVARYDIIHYHSIGPSVLSILPRLFRPGSRVIATFHSRDYLHKKWNAFARLCLRLAERATCTFPERTIVVSETLERHARAKYGREFIMIPNGADIAPEPSTDALQGWRLRPGRYALIVSRLIRHKGVHYAIQAFRDLERGGRLPNNFKLVIAGAPAHSAEYAEFLETLAGDDPNIVFVGEQTGRALQALYTHAAFFIQPSEDEGLSLALLEAMAHGLCPIVSAIPANLEAVGSTGVCFPSKDVRTLRDHMAYFVNRPEEAAALGTQSRLRAEANYSWDAIARRTEEAYQEALYAHASGAPLFPFRTK